jgi:hypothetical protein
MKELTAQRSSLDYGWWASNGPTAGYLHRLVLDAAAPEQPDVARSRRIDLHVFGPARAAGYTTAVSTQHGSDGLDFATVTFQQDRVFATASVLATHDRGRSDEGIATPPGVLPPDLYRPMPTPSPTLPPVTARFEYRPVTPDDLVASRPEWDAVWITPTDESLEGRRFVASAVDCWYPAHFMRAVRDHLGGDGPLEQPAPTTLTAATLTFTAPSSAYRDVRVALLANQLTAVAEGHFFERTEIWSMRGELLATAELIRRNENGDPHA